MEKIIVHVGVGLKFPGRAGRPIKQSEVHFSYETNPLVFQAAGGKGNENLHRISENNYIVKQDFEKAKQNR